MRQILRFSTTLALVSTLIGSGCASQSARPQATSSASVENETIADVNVTRTGNGSTVTLVGPRDPIFSSMVEQNPERIVVDLIAVEPGSIEAPIAVFDGLVEEVSLAPIASDAGAATTRVEIRLAQSADHDVVAGPSGLEIQITPRGAAPDAGADPWDSLPTAAGSSAAPMTSPAPARLDGQPASRLEDVVVRAHGNGTLVHLRADGRIDSTESFTLSNPDRLVIDLPGIVSAAGSDRVSTDSSAVTNVRIGKHADKVRVVLDGGAAARGFDGRQVLPAPDGLVVTLGNGPELESAVQAILGGSAPVPASSMAESAPTAPISAPVASAGVDSSPVAPMARVDGVSRILSVEYTPLDGFDRIVVVSDSPVDYLLFEPEAETAILSMQNARLDSGLDMRITPEPGSPVSLVSAFDQPDTRTPEVRLVMTRAANLKPHVTREGTLVMVDYPRTAAAGTLPMLAETGSTGASLAAGGAAKPSATTGSGGAIDILQTEGSMDEKVYVGDKISLDFKDVEMVDVLRLIADVSQLNVVAGDATKGRITMRLIDIPWDHALDVILQTKNLAFKKVGNVLRIAPKEQLAKEEQARLTEKRNLENLEDLVVKPIPVNYAKVSQVKNMVTRLLSERGTVDMDERTSTLILKDIQTVVDEAIALVNVVDTMTPQVLVESRIVEANIDFLREFGVTMNIEPTDERDTKNDIFSPGAGSSVLPDQTGGLFVNPLTATPTGLIDIAGTILNDRFNLDLQLQMAESTGEGKVISSPRVVTLDNERATILQGSSLPYQTFENGDAELTFIDAVLKLDVKPHITSDRSIIMEVNVSRNAPDSTVFTGTGDPAIAKNEVKTETLVKDGQTLVIGGIYVIDKAERHSRTPYLHRVPLLGTLFRSNEVNDTRRELLIFLTPRVLVTEALQS